MRKISLKRSEVVQCDDTIGIVPYIGIKIASYHRYKNIKRQQWCHTSCLWYYTSGTIIFIDMIPWPGNAHGTIPVVRTIRRSGTE